jgi:hypothetical protein
MEVPASVLMELLGGKSKDQPSDRFSGQAVECLGAKLMNRYMNAAGALRGKSSNKVVDTLAQVPNCLVTRTAMPGLVHTGIVEAAVKAAEMVFCNGPALLAAVSRQVSPLAFEVMFAVYWANWMTAVLGCEVHPRFVPAATDRGVDPVRKDPTKFEYVGFTGEIRPCDDVKNINECWTIRMADKLSELLTRKWRRIGLDEIVQAIVQRESATKDSLKFEVSVIHEPSINMTWLNVFLTHK